MGKCYFLYSPEGCWLHRYPTPWGGGCEQKAQASLRLALELLLGMSSVRWGRYSWQAGIHSISGGAALLVLRGCLVVGRSGVKPPEP